MIVAKPYIKQLAVLAVLAVVAAFFVFGFARADSEVKFPKEGWDRILIAKIEAGPLVLSKDFDTGVTPPPANDSIVTKGELDSMRRFKGFRSDDQLAKIQMEHNENVIMVFQEMGEFKLYERLKTASLFQALSRDIDYFILRDKMTYQRARPTQLADDLEPVIDIPKHAAYPSGHAGQSYFIALLLSELNPEKAEFYKQEARDIGHRREIAGVHYPSDTQAGILLAQNVFNAVMQDDTIRMLFEQAKTEF